MVSKNQLKLITSLHQKKYRHANRLFLAEGEKVIHELLHSNFALEMLYVSEGIFADVPPNLRTEASVAELKKMTALATPNNCIAIFKMPEQKPIDQKGVIVALDAVRDPGNLGTILRLCDWFGVSQVVCSHETVDVYNPKVVQATMGSISRVSVAYVDLINFLSESKLPIYGTFMDGKNIYNEVLGDAVVVFGNEANGISDEVAKLVHNRIAIPRFGDLQRTESLNVAMAASIVLSEFRRR